MKCFMQFIIPATDEKPDIETREVPVPACLIDSMLLGISSAGTVVAAGDGVTDDTAAVQAAFDASTMYVVRWRTPEGIPLSMNMPADYQSTWQYGGFRKEEP